MIRQLERAQNCGRLSQERPLPRKWRIIVSMATHEASAEVRGDATQVLDAAAAALSLYGFRVGYRGTTSLDLTGPGMRSSRQSPILGASRIRLSVENGRLSLAAELGAAARLGRFARVFPPVLALGATGIIGAVFLLTMPKPPAHLFEILGVVAAADVVVWLVLGPMIARSIERRTRAALDAFVATAARV